MLLPFGSWMTGSTSPMPPSSSEVGRMIEPMRGLLSIGGSGPVGYGPHLQGDAPGVGRFDAVHGLAHRGVDLATPRGVGTEVGEHHGLRAGTLVLDGGRLAVALALVAHAVVHLASDLSALGYRAIGERTLQPLATYATRAG